MWNGTFITKSFTDHFVIVSRVKDELLELVDVTVEFDADRTKQYVFTIPYDRYRPDKASIGKEILRQLKDEE